MVQPYTALPPSEMYMKYGWLPIVLFLGTLVIAPTLKQTPMQGFNTGLILALLATVILSGLHLL